MTRMKRAIACIIICFKPQALLMVCILTVILHSIVYAIQKAITSNWRTDKQISIVISIVIIVALWVTCLTFMLRYEIENEIETLLTLFQCSRRGLRFLGVVIFHIFLFLAVITLVSLFVDKTHRIDTLNSVTYSSASHVSHKAQHVTRLLVQDRDLTRIKPGSGRVDRRLDNQHLAVIYKIWLTALLYAFVYITLEHIITFYADLSLIEFVHGAFLYSVAKLTGIDLSDYPAGEMYFNPLVRRRLR